MSESREHDVSGIKEAKVASTKGHVAVSSGQVVFQAGAVVHEERIAVHPKNIIHALELKNVSNG